MKEYIVKEPENKFVNIDTYKTCFGEPVTELIRCKNCKYWNTVISNAEYGICVGWKVFNVTKDDDYCSKGEGK